MGAFRCVPLFDRGGRPYVDPGRIDEEESFDLRCFFEAYRPREANPDDGGTEEDDVVVERPGKRADMEILT